MHFAYHIIFDSELRQEEQDPEDSDSSKVTTNHSTVLTAAAIGAGLGFVTGGGIMALAGAGIGAASASERGRRAAGELAQTAGTAASHAKQAVCNVSHACLASDSLPRDRRRHASP